MAYYPTKATSYKRAARTGYSGGTGTSQGATAVLEKSSYHDVEIERKRLLEEAAAADKKLTEEQKAELPPQKVGIAITPGAAQNINNQFKDAGVDNAEQFLKAYRAGEIQRTQEGNYNITKTTTTTATPQPTTTATSEPDNKQYYGFTQSQLSTLSGNSQLKETALSKKLGITKNNVFVQIGEKAGAAIAYVGGALFESTIYAAFKEGNKKNIFNPAYDTASNEVNPEQKAAGQQQLAFLYAGLSSIKIKDFGTATSEDLTKINFNEPPSGTNPYELKYTPFGRYSNAIADESGARISRPSELQIQLEPKIITEQGINNNPLYPESSIKPNDIFSQERINYLSDKQLSDFGIKTTSETEAVPRGQRLKAIYEDLSRENAQAKAEANKRLAALEQTKEPATQTALKDYNAKITESGKIVNTPETNAPEVKIQTSSFFLNKKGSAQLSTGELTTDRIFINNKPTTIEPKEFISTPGINGIDFTKGTSLPVALFSNGRIEPISEIRSKAYSFNIPNIKSESISNIKINYGLVGKQSQAQQQEQSLFTGTKIKQIQLTTQMQVQQQIQIQQQDTTQIQQQIQATQQTSITRNIYNQIKTTKEPIKPLFIPPKKPKEGKRNTTKEDNLYNVFVRKKGIFQKVNSKPLNQAVAINYGANVVKNTAAATFKLISNKPTAGANKGLFAPASLKNDFYTKGNLFIQKRSKRISSVGEKRAIPGASAQAKRIKKLYGA